MYNKFKKRRRESRVLNNKNYTFKFGSAKLDVDVSKMYINTPSPPRNITNVYNHLVPHYHAKHELFFVGDEPITIFDGETMREFSNCIVCVPPFFHHYSIRAKDRRILFSFETKDLILCEFSRFLDTFFSSSEIFSFTTENSIEPYLSALDEYLTQSNEMAKEASEAILKIIFYNIYTSKAQKSKDDFSIKESYLIIIERIINSYSLNPAMDVSLDTVANELHVGTRQASRIIYKYFKKTLAELVTEKRLSVAVNMLKNTDISISEIAKAANFKSENYFFLQFKRAYGMTPLHYRKNSRRAKD